MEKSNTSADVAAAVAATETQIEIVGERRRMRDAAFRAWVVEACLAPGARVPELARRFGTCTSLIDRWRRAALEEAAAQPCAAAPALPDKARGAETPLGFVPVGVLGRAEDGGPALIAHPAPAVTAAPLPGHVPRPSLAVEDRAGMIEIDLACGARLRVDAFVNERALRRVLAALRMEGRRDPGGARDQGISGLPSGQHALRI